MNIQLKQFQQLWTKEWILKFISLCLAVLLWVFVGGEEKVDKNVMIPIEVINLPRDLVISNQFKKEVEVTVNGPRSVILEMGKMAITRAVDLSDYRPGSHVVEIPVDSIKMPRMVTVERVQPSSIILSLDKLISKDLHINAVTNGDVANGYYVKNLIIEPDVITITGPQSELSRVDVLKTESINIGGMKESTQLQIPLDLDPDIVELIGETSVTADVQIEMLLVEQYLKDLPVKVVVDGVEKTVSPATVDVRVKVPKVLLDENQKVEDLFVVTTIGEDHDSKKKVGVIPSIQNGFPIEIVSIDPHYVTFDLQPSMESETSGIDEEFPPGTPIIKKDKTKIVK